MAQYDEDTFELEDTPEDSSTEVETPETTEEVEEVSTPESEPDEVETPEVETPETPPEDNWEVRARYQQSEADKFKNIVEQQRVQLQQLIDAQKPKEVVEELPQKPNSDDPEEWIQYNAKMNEHILKEMQSAKEANQEKERQAQKLAEQAKQRDWALGEMTKVTKNPDKSQKILELFADPNNFSNPAVYNVMYDAYMDYKNHKPSGKPNPKAPPPPIDGGEEPDTGKRTPDDDFNEQTFGEDTNYRL